MTKYLPHIIALLFILAFVIYAQWTEPMQSPPLGNTPPPINVGSTSQVKAGSLGIKGFLLSQKDMVGRRVITNNSGVSISASYTDYSYYWTKEERYSLSLSDLNFLYSLPGNNCQTSFGPIQTAGIYEKTVKATPSQFSFSCNDMVLRPIETFILRDRGLEFSASGYCAYYGCYGDSQSTVRSFWSNKFPGDLSETLYMPPGSKSCTVKISICGVGGEVNKSTTVYSSEYSSGSYSESTAKPYIASIKLGGETIYAISNPLPYYGQYGKKNCGFWGCYYTNESSYNLLKSIYYTSQPTCITVTKQNLSPDPKSLTVDTIWIEKYYDSVTERYTAIHTNYLYQQPPSVWYSQVAYDCQLP